MSDDSFTQGSGTKIDFSLDPNSTYSQESGTSVDFSLSQGTSTDVEYDAVIQQQDITTTADYDAVIATQEEVKPEYDTVVKDKGKTSTAEYDTVVKDEGRTVTADYDTVLTKQSSLDVDYDTVVKAENTVTTDYDTVITAEYSVTADYDTVLVDSFETGVTYDTAIQDQDVTETVEYDTRLVNIGTVTADYDAYIAFGRPGATTYYVDKTEITTVQDIKVKERLNELHTFEGKIYVPDDATRTNVQEGNNFRIFEGTDLAFKGRLENVEYESRFLAKVEGFGMSVKMLNKKTDRKEYSNTAGDEIIKDQVNNTSGIKQGTIDSAPVLSIRFDHDNRLRAAAGVANALGWDWYVDQKKSEDFDKDYFNFVSRKGSSTSQYTFDIGNNARMVNRDKDQEHVANDILLLGRGDGINQLEANVFAATTKRTTTAAKLDSGTTPNSFSVDDASQLGNDGDDVDLRIGTEVVNATLDTTNDELDIKSRGLNDYNGDSTEDIDHYDGIQVWLKENKTTGEGPYEPTSSGAESGSSIDSFGVREEKVTDRTIVDKPTLEKVADNELKDRRQDIFRVQVRTSENRIKDNIELGDTVTVKDVTAMDVDDTFRVVGFDYHRGTSEKMVIHCANRPLRLTERLRDIERETDTTSTHMQGSTNIDSQNFGDNCDNSHPLKTEVRIPDDAVAVNKVEVAFSRESFRGYVKNQNHSHSVDVTHPSHSHDVSDTSTDSLSGETQIANFSDSDSSLSDGSKEAKTSSVSSFSGEITFYDFELDVDDFSGDYATGEVQIENSTTNEEIFMGTVHTEDVGQLQMQGTTNAINSGDDIKIWFENESGETVTLDNLEITIYALDPHNHDISDTSTAALGTTNSETSTNAGSPNYGIFEPGSEPDIDVDVVADGTTVKTVNNVSVSQTVDPIDVKSELSEPIAGSYHTIKLVPVDTGGGNDGRSRLNATVFSKVFVESKT